MFNVYAVDTFIVGLVFRVESRVVGIVVPFYCNCLLGSGFAMLQ